MLSFVLITEHATNLALSGYCGSCLGPPFIELLWILYTAALCQKATFRTYTASLHVTSCSLKTYYEMSSNNTPAPARTGGLSLYANLLDPISASTPGSISKAPVIFKNPVPEPVEEEPTTKKPQIDAGIS